MTHSPLELYALAGRLLVSDGARYSGETGGAAAAAASIAGKMISFSTLLGLDEHRFMRLLEGSTRIREQVEETVSQRGAATGG